MTVLVAVLIGLSASQNIKAAASLDEMAEAANALLSTLDPDQTSKISFEWNADERFNWHFIPRDRLGLPLKGMRDDQRALAHGLLTTGMGQRGYMKAVSIMSLERVLWELENHAPHRDAGNYFFSIFGKPEIGGTWGWRVEGHHLSLNFTIVDGRLFSGTPSFYGTNPGEVKEGPRKGFKVLKVEEDLGLELINAFSDEQRKKTVFDAKAPRDVITGADRKVSLLEPMGISFAELNNDQKDMLLGLTREYVFRSNAKFAELEWAKLGAQPDLYFAWAGGLKSGTGTYYRIQGPGFLIEYDNTQNNANHVHAVYRDLKNDFGDDLLRLHYEQNAHK